MARKRENRKSKIPATAIKYDANEELNLALNVIAKNRTGGAVNINGIGFQLLYSCFVVLNELDKTSLDKFIRVEGIEDIDVIHINNNEYLQLKSSINDFDAGTFWNLHILQNFLEVFTVNPKSKLRLIHNSKISKGKLKKLSENNLDNEAITYWKNKFIGANIDISSINFHQFLRSINFEKVSETSLFDRCIKILIEKYSINTGTEKQYLKALFFQVFYWSKERKVVEYNDVLGSIQAVTDSFSKSPTNPAINNNWIEEVVFDATGTEHEIEYFEGKAAKPIHIAQNLPVSRKEWELKIKKAIQDFNLTVIKSSSGQGKSTLAWQVVRDLQNSGFSIYVLNYCEEWENVTHISDFIQTRLKIGKLPIIVIDGLNNMVSQYQELVSKVSQLPVKFLVTAREEDWYRYGMNNSKIRLHIIDIKLTIVEAKDIFQQLKRRGKVHDSINKWEPVWEKIELKGLLVEYVYLLTRGQMIHDRLQQQVKILSLEKDANVKIEILRLIAVSDILNIKIQTLSLTKYIQNTIGFESDRGEVLKQLKEEYYLKFDDKYVEGLHPVRSQHLADILHEALPISESLINLFKIIDTNFIYDYFITVSSLVHNDLKQELYSDLAKQVAILNFSEMVYAIDGLMHSEPYRYWIENRQVFDEVYNSGGIELFVGDTLPFTKLNTIKQLTESMGDKFPNLPFLSEKLKELTYYDIKDSDVSLFVQNLSKQLSENNIKVNSYEGLGFLVKWFRQLSIPFPLIVILNEEKLIKLMDKSSIDESSELFNYLQISDSKTHSNFIKNHKSKIISLLKKGTNSLTIEETGDDLSIEYLLDDNADKVNEYSVYRIQTVFNFLPSYNRYCTKAIILPFPNEEIYKVVIDNSTKAMPKENIADTFDIHINQIWNQTILDNYRSKSSFEWQEQYIKLRQEGLEFCKICTRYFEVIIENNSSRQKSATTRLIEQGLKLSGLIKKRRKYPRQTLKYFDKEAFSNEQKTINTWCSSLDNFLNQVSGIVYPKSDNDRNLAFINLKAAVYNLTEMQGAFKQVQSETFQYIETTLIDIEEQNWYNRLLKTVSFYVNQFIKLPDKNIFVAKTEVEYWWKSYQDNRLQQIHSVITDFEIDSYFTFHLPNKVYEEENLNYVVIGVDRIDLENIEDESLKLIAGLVDLALTDVDFFTFVNIHKSEAINAFRVQKSLFKRVKVFLETGEFEEAEYGNPIPINLEESTLESLDGISIKKIKIQGGDESFIKMMFDIWKLSESRKRLNKVNNIEDSWLKEIEIEYQEKIKSHIAEIVHELEAKEFIEIEKSVSSFLKEERKFTNDEIVQYMNERVKKINSQLN